MNILRRKTKAAVFIICMVISITRDYAAFEGKPAGAEETAAAEEKESSYFALISGVDLCGAVMSSGSSAEGAAVVIHRYSEEDAMLFSAEDAGEGAVYLKNRGSGLYLAAEDNSPESGAGVTERGFTGEDAQKWYLRALEDGHYLVASKLGTVLDLAGGSTEDGTRILLCDSNEGLNQEWDLLPEGTFPDGMDQSRGTNLTGEVPSGRYVITSGLDDHMAFGIAGKGKEGALLEIRKYNGLGSQIFVIGDNGDGTYRILSDLNDGLSLDVKDASPESGAVLQMRAYDGTKGQMWQIEPSDEFGFYRIRSVLGNVLDVYEARKTNGTNVGMFMPTEGRNQLWRLFRIG